MTPIVDADSAGTPIVDADSAGTQIVDADSAGTPIVDAYSAGTPGILGVRGRICSAVESLRVVIRVC